MFNISEILFKICVRVLQQRKIPGHIAFIVDGNRTFSRAKNISFFQAYIIGMKVILHEIELCKLMNISHLTFYLFSKSNWRRSESDIRNVLTVINIFLKTLISNDRGCCYRVIGNEAGMPLEIRTLCDILVQHTRNNDVVTIYLAINYSSKEEMFDIVNIMNDTSIDELQSKTISKYSFDKLIYSSNNIAPDLIIRTSKQKRLSDFLLWQAAHSTLLFTDKCWPEFSKWCLLKAIFQYQRSC